MKWFAGWAATLALTVAACGGDQPGVSAVTAADISHTKISGIEAGRDIYNFRCYFCHGYSGDARTVAASFLTPPPVNFTIADASRLTSEYIVQILKNGKPGTAMTPFSSVLSDTEMKQVAEFVVHEFVEHKATNTRYHTPENGWPDHERYRAAFPFATGEITVSTSWESLTEDQTRGKHLFLSSCVSCHDRGKTADDTAIWEPRALSYPRNNYSHTAPQPLDGMSSASPYLLHDIPPRIENLSAHELRGKQLFEDNCAFCHGADGTGKNWIGSFLEPHPRNLQDPAFMRHMTRALLTQRIMHGLPETSMPAWESVLSADEISSIVAYIARAFHPLSE